jgi:plasmid stabilization system protein ParE
MPSFLVETYLARRNAGVRAARERRARSAAGELARERTDGRVERSIYGPEDEICFFVFDAPTSRDAALIAQRARLDPIRVVAAESSREENRRK